MKLYRTIIFVLATLLVFAFGNDVLAACQITNAQLGATSTPPDSVSFTAIFGMSDCSGQTLTVDFRWTPTGDIGVRSIPQTFSVPAGNPLSGNTSILLTPNDWQGRPSIEIYARITGPGQNNSRDSNTMTVNNPTTQVYACVAANNIYTCTTDGTLAACQNAPGCRASDNPKAPCIQINNIMCGKDAGGSEQYGCIDSANVYRCASSMGLCESIPACQPSSGRKWPCGKVESNRCNQQAPAIKYACVVNGIITCGGDTKAACEASAQCSGKGSCSQMEEQKCGQPIGTDPPSPRSGSIGNLTLKLPPLKNPSGFSDLMAAINAVSRYLFTAAIPIAVIMIIYAGIRFLLARDNQSEVTKARQILWWAILGLAIITVGRGFIALISSFISFPSTG